MLDLIDFGWALLEPKADASRGDSSASVVGKFEKW